MIKVNLLPPEYRKVEGTPIARFVALLIGVFVTATAMSLWGWMHFGVLAEVTKQRQQIEEELSQASALAARSQTLLREAQEYQKRRDTIEQIGRSRVLWSKKLDQLADLIHNKGDVKRHLVWLSSIRTSSGGAKDNGGKLEIGGLSGGGEYARMSDFNEDLKNDQEFFQDFLRVDPPTGKLVTFNDGRHPAEAWSFKMAMDLKPKEQLGKAKSGGGKKKKRRASAGAK